jgi:tetratricopeptide (TPR) repeat protein
MAPALLILAAVGIERLAALRHTWRRQWRVLGLVALAMGLGLLLAWGNFYDVWTYRVPEISVNTGVIEREAGDFPAAVRHLREGLALDPHDGLAWVHLALALEQEGQPRAALQAYLDALTRVPDDTGLEQMAAGFWQRQRLDPALLETYVNATDATARDIAATRALRALER